MEYSKNFEKVKNYYIQGIWSEQMVKNSIGKWITQEEYDEILNSREGF